MALNTPCIRTASRRLLQLRPSDLRPSRGDQQLRQCLRCISTANTERGPRSARTTKRYTDEAAYRQQRTSLNTFSTSTRLAKKSKGTPTPLPSKDGASASEDPRDFTVLEKEIATAHERLKEALSKLRSGGRFNHELLERIRVQPDKDSKSKVPLSDLAQVIPKGRTVQVIVGEKDYLKPVSSAITSSDLQLTPHPDPTGANPLLLEIKIPPPTAESRQNAVKEAVKAGGNAGVAIRDARAKQHKKHGAMKSTRSVSPDDLRKGAAEMEKVVEKAQAEVKRLVDAAKKMLEAV